jgi:transcriptional regulator with AAA-type ATPase domain
VRRAVHRRELRGCSTGDAESEFFASERGAFTGAVTRERVFERASGGTLFLDETGDLSASAQAVLRRVLDQKIVSRLGGEIAVDVRVIAATNTALRRAVRDGPVSRRPVSSIDSEAFMERMGRTLQGNPKRLSASAWSALP